MEKVTVQMPQVTVISQKKHVGRQAIGEVNLISGNPVCHTG